MDTELVQNLQEMLEDLQREVFARDLLFQAAGLALAILLALGLRGPLTRLLGRARAWLDETELGRHLPQLGGIVEALSSAVMPLLTWLFAWAAATVLEGIDVGTAFLRWLLPLLGIWFGFRLAASLLGLFLVEERALFWARTVLRPLFAVIVLLYVAGLLQSVLSERFSWQGATFTVATLLVATGVVILSVIIARVTRMYLGTVVLPRAGLEPALTHALSQVSAYLIVTAGVLFALGMVGISMTTLAVVLGGLSVGIGFGLQEIVSNLISGFILLFDRSIGPGDIVQVGDNVGRVEDVTFRSTRIRTIDNIELIVPNSSFLTDVVTNYTRSDVHIRVNIGVGVSYDAEPRAVEKALLAAAKHPLVLEEPSPEVEFIEFGASSLDFSLEVWTDDPLNVQSFTSEIRYNIWDELKAAGIQIPYPQQDLHIRTMPVPRER